MKRFLSILFFVDFQLKSEGIVFEFIKVCFSNQNYIYKTDFSFSIRWK